MVRKAASQASGTASLRSPRTDSRVAQPGTGSQPSRPENSRVVLTIVDGFSRLEGVGQAAVAATERRRRGGRNSSLRVSMTYTMRASLCAAAVIATFFGLPRLDFRR